MTDDKTVFKSGCRAATLEFPLEEMFMKCAVDFILTFAEENFLEIDDREMLARSAMAAFSLIREINGQSRASPPLILTVAEREGCLLLNFLNHGMPIIQGGSSGIDGYLKRHQVSPERFDGISVENLGREGQVISLRMSLGKSAIPLSVVEEKADREELTLEEDSIEIRELRDGEEGALSRLFYHVYGYNYINDFIYFPEKVHALIKEGKLISIVGAAPNGRLVGHVGLMRKNDRPLVLEPCLGVTDPHVKSRGLFGRIFQATMERGALLPVSYYFFDFVTNHDLSQRLINRYGCIDMAIFLACQNRNTQAKLSDLGIGMDPKGTDRYSILYSVIPRVKNPFGREVFLPNNLGQMLGFLLEPLEMRWMPCPRFSILASEGAYTLSREPAQQMAMFDCAQPGLSALEGIIKDWQHLEKDGYKYAAVDIPLEASGLGSTHEFLALQGFFPAGFVPHRCSDRLAIRFQTVAPSKLDFSEIIVFSEQGKKLLRLIKDNYERNIPHE